MPSLSQTAAPGPFLVLGLANFLSVLVFLGSPSAARGASLGDRRLLRGGGGGGGADVRSADVDVLKALEYMEGLRQGAGADAPRYDDDDAEKLRAVLRLVANPVRSKEEEEEEEEEEEGREDKSEELLQAVLSTLQRTEEKASEPAAPPRPRPQPRRGGILPHEKLPLMFEDDEDEEGEGDEEEAGERGRSPFKRTNENVEEKYTPQNLATLQSVFDELDKMTSTKSAQRRGDGDVEEEEEEEDGEDEDDTFNARNAGYDDGDLAVWGPPQEEEEEEEKQEADRGLDYVDEEEEEDEGDREESYPVKRSSEPDDVANLVDYYLLKVLEKTEEEEQKREIEEEEEEEEEKQRAERRAQHRGDIDPRAVYQLIRISQKYQIPPEDLVDMLRTGETMKSGGGGGAPRAGNELPRVPPKTTRLRIPEAKFYGRQKTPEERRTEEILGILGLGPAEPRVPPYKSSPSRLRTRPAPPPPRSGGSAPAQRRPPPKDEDDDNSDYDEDELAAFLAARMPPRRPKPRGRWGQKRDEVAGQSAAAAAAAAGSFERAAQAYFDRMDSESGHEEKRRAEEEGEETGGEETRMRGFDNEAVMKLLSALNPETTGSNDTTGRGF
ncbi:secretogranin-2a [Clinocottus analis]|uniref:secretogranin-2a n=1 Tax=Clinocottus analis TaxID=304258 RepID=UPI0035C056FE